MVNKKFMSGPLIKSFKGLRYNNQKAGDISSCVCPPYDIIPDVSPYYQRNPFNAIHLELPQPADGLDQYDNAKKTLDTWLNDEILRFEDQETVYIYEQEFSVQGKSHTRRGIIPLVRLNKESILTHEETRKNAREDREKLIEKLRTYTSLVFAMYEDRSRDIEGLVENSKKEKLYDFTDELAIKNRFYRMTDKTEIARLVALMDGKNIYIADGHHRLSVSFKLGLPYLAIYLTNMYSDGITILPYHRVVKLKNAIPASELLHRVEPYFDILPMEYKGKETLFTLIDAVSSARILSFLVYTGGKNPTLYLLKQKSEIDFDRESHEILRRLKVNVIHSGVLKHVMGISDEEISFPTDPTEAVSAVDEGRFDFAVFVPATSVDEVKDIAENNLFMPPKSTYFYPKILTGLVLYKYA